MTTHTYNRRTPFALVVNDDPTQLNLLSGLLREAGVEPRAFTAAEAALADMSAGARTADGDPGALPALVVIDLYMPGIDGWRFCRLLRSPEYAAFNQVPILVVSATFAGDEASRIAADVGADAFLPSPVDAQRFCEQVRAILTGERMRIPLRVLIVDDNAPLCDLLKEDFADHGYQADTALTIRAAADAFAKTAYDVAVLDYHLPDGQGDALLDEFRARRPDCVCLMMTSATGPALALEWMKRGAAAYLQKPFQPDYLIELCGKARRERALLGVQDLLEKRTRELRASEERYRSLVEESPDIIGIFHEERLVFINSTGARQLGAKTKGELLGRKTEDLFHPDDLPAALARIQRRLAGETGMYPAEVRYMRLDGTTLPVEVIATPIIFHEKTAVQFIARDITERKRAEEALRAKDRLVEDIIASAQEGVIVYDRNLRYQVWNPFMEGITGVSASKVIGRLPLEVFPFLRETGIMERLERALAGETHGAIDFPYSMLETGRSGWASDASSPLRNAAGEIIGVVGTVRDIAERKRAEAEKAKLEAQFQQAQKMESVGRLAGGVAHDFNNMLQAILGNVDLALEVIPPGSPVRESLEEIQSAALRSADLIRQLLAFARQQTIAPKLLNFNEAVEGLLKMLKRLIGEDIHLTWLPAAGLGPVKLDPTQIDQILANLCINARDAIGGVGKITLETGNAVFDEAYCADHLGFVPGEYVRLAVSDDGCGMDKETLAHLFEPFFTTKGVGQGTGLGLATVYGIVKQNHGFIHVYSEPGQGTTFKIHLPQHASQAAATRTETAGELLKSRGETVLLVEDEPAILALARRILKRLGYTVLNASTPSEAIRLAGAHAGEIHLLITDVVMPEMNGRDLARRLLSHHPKLKCLFMSGYTADVIAHRGVLDEGVHFIHKPFSIKDLAAKVREVLEAE